MLSMLGLKRKGTGPIEGGISLSPFRSPTKETSLAFKERQAYSPLYSQEDDDRDEHAGSRSTGHRHSSSVYSILDGADRITSPPPGYRPPSNYQGLVPRLSRKRPSRRCVVLLVVLSIASSLYICAYIFFRPPNYVVLPPERYLDYLNHTLATQIPTEHVRDALSRHLDQIRYPPPSILEPGQKAADQKTLASGAPKTDVPRTIWSSDGKPAPDSWFAKWAEMGADVRFLDDAGAEAWVEKHWHGTETKKMWDAMPRFILKADLLRYLLLLVEGGTWSDMDTVPLMPVADWAKDVVSLSSVLEKKEGRSFASMVGSPSSQWKKLQASQDAKGADGDTNAAREPIRAIIGIESDPTENAGIRAYLERVRLLPLNRHRPLQFVQWTLHLAPNHPILLDVLRRILQATDIYLAREAEKERESFAEGWGWDEPHRRDPAKMARERPVAAWEAIRYKWKWQAGNWRWGWDINSVEEWTGPPVWTDAVISYLYASAGVRPEDLVGLKQPVQIRDVVIVPSSGFNPPRDDLKETSRIVHMFRNSWKH